MASHKHRMLNKLYGILLYVYTVYLLPLYVDTYLYDGYRMLMLE